MDRQYQLGQRPGGPEAMNSTAAVIPDAMDRISELLRSSIDVQDRITNQLSRSIDKLIGQVPESPTGDLVGGDHMSIANLLGELERSQARTQRQLDRLKETKI